MGKLTQTGILVAISVAIGSITFAQQSVTPPKVYDLFGDYAGGQWKYGYFSANRPLGKKGDRTTYEITLYAPAKTENGITRSQRNHELNEPHILKCHRPQPCRIDGDNEYECPNTRYLEFHPGPNGEYSAARWEAADSTKCHLDFQFKSLKTNGISVDVYVVHTAQVPNGDSGYKIERKIIWNDVLAGPRQSADSVRDPAMIGNERYLPVIVRAGDYVDFVVGYGPNKTYQGDITGVRATVICLN